MNTSFEDQIRERAYHIWLADGMTEGMAHEHWVSAERAVREEIAPKAIDAKSNAAKSTATKASPSKPAAAKAPKAKRASAKAGTALRMKAAKDTQGLSTH